MSTLEISSLTGIAHDQILRRVKKMINELGLDGLVESSYINSQNKKQPMFELDEHQTMYILIDCNPELKMKVVTEFNTRRNPVMTPLETAKALVLSLEREEKHLATIALMQPAVEIVRNIVESDGLLGLSEVAKQLNMKPQTMNQWLQCSNVLDKKNVAYQRYVDNGYFSIKLTRIDSIGKINSTTKVTPKGLVWLTKKINELRRMLESHEE